MIYTHDHEPMHVHRLYGDEVVVIHLENLTIREVRAMQAPNVRRALEIVANNREKLIGCWQEIRPVA